MCRHRAAKAHDTICLKKERDGKDGSLMAAPPEMPQQLVQRPVYSIVAPVFNEEQTLPHFYARTIAVLEQLGAPFELVLVNDGSRDGSYQVLRELYERDPRVRVVNFSRNFG